MNPRTLVRMQNPVAMLGLEGFKAALRSQYQHIRPRTYDEALEQAASFWGFYEEANRQYCPDDPVYSVTRDGITPVAGNDYLTFITAASRQVRYLEFILGSAGTASAAARSVFQRSTGGTTGGGALTPERFNQLSPASAAFSNIYTTWTGQPTLSGVAYIAWAWNALGGMYDWKAPPGSEIYQQGSSEQTSWRNVAGTAVVSLTAIFEEL